MPNDGSRLCSTHFISGTCTDAVAKYVQLRNIISQPWIKSHISFLFFVYIFYISEEQGHIRKFRENMLKI